MQTKIIPTEEGEPIAVEIMEQAIVDIAAAMKRFEASRLTRRAIVILIQSKTNLNRSDISTVMDSLASLESDWLKPKIIGAKA